MQFFLLSASGWSWECFGSYYGLMSAIFLLLSQSFWLKATDIHYYNAGTGSQEKVDLYEEL